MPFPSPRLWVVAGTLGNPGDFSPRAHKVIQDADLILAEDTRRAGLFFQRHGIVPSGVMRSLYEHNEEDRIPSVLEALKLGNSVALISDAGTPLIGDPGYRLVRACRTAGFLVSPVPGPCAPVAALCASGLPPSPFTFLGFLPRQPGGQRRLFHAWADMTTTLVFFERNSRLRATLRIALECFGPRELCLARELTKEHEQIIQGRLEAHDDMQWDHRGEMTVLIGPPSAPPKTLDSEVDQLLTKEARFGPPKEVAARVAGKVHGWSSKEIYARLMALSRPGSASFPEKA
ncbi:MAG: 16S rRNA (cytidine(1402)-2'-O)-methyltransferase [Desulfovibrionales bacterium]|nr:MAG: 16S rRNA (cytidine(1402)-2'-O)-methyltransferase [Desulfovibrionales bacterium]